MEVRSNSRLLPQTLGKGNYYCHNKVVLMSSKQTMVTANWTHLLEQMSNWDKDERYMATNDLCNLLKDGNVKIDNVLEHKICTAVLKQLGQFSIL